MDLGSLQLEVQRGGGEEVCLAVLQPVVELPAWQTG